MNLLFDQNISFRIVKPLKIVYPGARHVSEIGLKTDMQIWDFAKENRHTIVTFDSDFYDLMALRGHPPKIIWLRIGNTTTRNLTKLFEHHFDIIKSFLTDKSYSEIGCLEIDG